MRKGNEMKTYKAFTDNTLTQGKTKYQIGHQTRTNKPCLLRVSGIHSCTTPEAAKAYYPKNTVIVECEVSKQDVRENFNGLVVSTAITPERFLNAAQAPTPVAVSAEDDSDDFDSVPYDSDGEEREEIASELRIIANRLENM
jgi:hypothetical protein